jgi:CubicO group peptidase (beta-lactamase class C family)
MGQSLQDLAQLRIFELLGMEQTSFTWRSGYENEMAAGHDKAQKPLLFRRYDVGHIARGLYASPQDYAHFMAAVLTSPLVQQMGTPEVKIND